MTIEQTITIVNNSGKIISTGKQLFSIFKEAQASYKDKKAQIKSERSLQRSQTIDPSYEPYEDDARYYYEREARYSHDGGSDTGSRRSHRSRSVHSKRIRDADARSRLALTEGNLKTHSEYSSVAPSRAPPKQYMSPYAETLPMDMALSKRDLTHAEMRSMAVANRGPGTVVPRRRSEPDFAERKPAKEIDMHLAYGNIPPDLESRTDLDPVCKEEKARSLIHRVEGLLDEAHCVHHSATATMTHLQKNPQAAAAVALSLAELSKLASTMSPAFLAFLKGGSPAVFSLLASPQFLIGTSIALGVTVVCFGGWKIVKKVREQQMARETLAYEGIPMDRPAPMRTQSEFTTGMDEALILEDELSTIETWRRGIAPYGEDESADLELITPKADRDTREKYEQDDFDLKSRRSTKTSKSHKSHRSERTERTERTERSHRSHRSSRSHSNDRSERRSSRHSPESITDSERSHRSRSSRKTKAIEDGKSRRASEDLGLVIRPKSQNMLKALFKSKEKKEREMVYA
ncbi:Fc.00g115010.m01.CDS01 [Cosmosporella sp. VM-42]